jgi:hypothetical protein
VTPASHVDTLVHTALRPLAQLRERNVPALHVLHVLQIVSLSGGVVHAVSTYSFAAHALQLHCAPWHATHVRSLVGVGFTDSTVTPPTHGVRATHVRSENNVGMRVS